MGGWEISCALAPIWKRVMETPATSSHTSNHLLSSLSAADFDLLKEDLQGTELPLRLPIEVPKEPISHIYFPGSGLISVVATSNGKQQIEVGIIGREGMTGLSVIMGNSHAVHNTYVQVVGAGHRIMSKHLRLAMDESPSLRDSMLHFALAFINQVSHTALSNGRAKIEERLARWLLMAHDRVDGNELRLTHEFLSLMMSVRRAGVTNAVSLLKSQGLIDGHAGKIIILDRAGLKLVAGGFYGKPEAEYKRLTGWSAKR